MQNNQKQKWAFYESCYNNRGAFCFKLIAKDLKYRSLNFTSTSNFVTKMPSMMVSFVFIFCSLLGKLHVNGTYFESNSLVQIEILKLMFKALCYKFIIK